MKTGINTGILTNAYPLSTEQIKELEKLALEEQKAFAYLDENSQLCFALPGGVDGIKDLAWNNVYELHSEEGTFTKKVYIKTGLDTYTHTATLTKLSIDDAWQGDNSSDQPVVMKAAGLYETGTDTMIISWDKLVSEGAVKVENGILTQGVALPSPMPEMNEYGFYYNIGYEDGYGFTLVFKEDGLMDVYMNGTLNFSSDKVVYSYKKVDVYGDGQWIFNMSSDGLSATDTDDMSYRVGEKTFSVYEGDLILPSNEGITSIDGAAFGNSTGLTGITIPDSVISIGESAFLGCNNLMSATIGNGVTTIGYDAFYSCSSLTSIVIPASVTSIGSSAFYQCSSLTEIVIPDSVTFIDGSTFSYCSNLVSIVIPASVTSIGGAAFYKCNNLTNIYYKGTEEQWNAIFVNDFNEALTNATVTYNYQG